MKNKIMCYITDGLMLLIALIMIVDALWILPFEVVISAGERFTIGIGLILYYKLNLKQ